MNIQQYTTSEVADTNTVMANNEDIDTPSPQHILNVFAAVDLSSHLSPDSNKYKHAWLKEKVICYSILSAGECTDACSISLSIALNYKQNASIIAVTSAIFPKKYASTTNQHEQKKYILFHATSVGDKQKQTEYMKTFVISNIVSIVSSTSKKADQNEVHALKDLLQCSISILYRQKKASTKRVHLISQFHNTEVRWSIKPFIVLTKTVSKLLRQKLVDWVMKNSNVCESPISHDTLLITNAESGVKRIVPKLLGEVK